MTITIITITAITTVLITRLSTLNYQRCRAPINSVLGQVIKTYSKVGYGSSKYWELSELRYLQGPPKIKRHPYQKDPKKDPS